MPNVSRWMPLLALLLCLPACVGSPQPSPPNLEAEFLGAQAGRGADFIEGVRVFGDPGSVMPAEGSVVVTVLEGDAPPVAEPVQPDGSFDVILPSARQGDTVRVQVRNGGARSEPIDRVLGEDELQIPARDACFVVALELDAEEVSVGSTEERTLRVENRCPEARTLEVRLRAAGPFEVREPPREIGPSASTEVRLSVRPTAAGIAEQILFVDAVVETATPILDRRPVTLFVTGTP